MLKTFDCDFDFIFVFTKGLIYNNIDNFTIHEQIELSRGQVLESYLDILWWIDLYRASQVVLYFDEFTENVLPSGILKLGGNCRLNASY